MVERQLGCLAGARQRLAIEAVGKDGVDRAVGPGADLEAAPAGRLEALDAVVAGEPQDAEAGAEALLGMGPAAQDHVDQGGGVGSDRARLALDALVCPAGVAAMGTRHVLGHGGVAAAGAAQQMAGDTLALVKQLDGALGDARLDLLAQQAVRHRVVMAVDVDVIVERDAALAPLGVDVGLDRQSSERRPIELVEQLATTDAEAPHRPVVELAEQCFDLVDAGLEIAHRRILRLPLMLAFPNLLLQQALGLMLFRPQVDQPSSQRLDFAVARHLQENHGHHRGEDRQTAVEYRAGRQLIG